MIVAIDGPGGTGKSTVSKTVAELTGLPHLDTGAFYRAATLAGVRAGVTDAEDGLIALVARTQFDQRDGRMYLDGQDVSNEIRGEEVTSAVSSVAAVPRIREILVQHQRQWVKERGDRAVVEGRDIGSVVFPEADVKIYLDATPEMRAQRRAAETGDDVDDVLEDLHRRDGVDSRRAASPLTIPIGAIVIDTTELTIDEVVSEVIRHIEATI